MKQRRNPGKMRAVYLIAAIAVPVLIALKLVPAAEPYQLHLTISALAVAVALLVAILAGGTTTEPKAAKAEAAKPAPPPTVAANQAEAEVVAFLATLQEKAGWSIS